MDGTDVRVMGIGRPRQYDPICSLEDCTGDHWAKGFCRKHWNRVKRNGDPNVTKKPRPEHIGAFIETALDTTTDECVMWPFKVQHKGYAVWADRRVGRMVLERTQGPAPKGRPLCLHSCHTPACINPAHLRWGTAKENTADMMHAGRGANGFGPLKHRPPPSNTRTVLG